MPAMDLLRSSGTGVAGRRSLRRAVPRARLPPVVRRAGRRGIPERHRLHGLFRDGLRGERPAPVPRRARADERVLDQPSRHGLSGDDPYDGDRLCGPRDAERRLARADHRARPREGAEGHAQAPRRSGRRQRALPRRDRPGLHGGRLGGLVRVLPALHPALRGDGRTDGVRALLRRVRARDDRRSRRGMAGDRRRRQGRLLRTADLRGQPGRVRPRCHHLVGRRGLHRPGRLSDADPDRRADGRRTSRPAGFRSGPSSRRSPRDGTSPSS